MQNRLLWIVVAVVVVGGGYWYWQSTQTQQLSDDNTSAAVEDAGVVQVPMPVIGSTTPETVVSPATSASVSYDGKSFSPSEVTIKKGGTVTFTSTGSAMWIASGPHPQHTNYDGTSREAHCAAGAVPSFDQCKSGNSYTFTFNKAGTWPYHNHVSGGMFGKVVVVE